MNSSSRPFLGGKVINLYKGRKNQYLENLDDLGKVWLLCDSSKALFCLVLFLEGLVMAGSSLSGLSFLKDLFQLLSLTLLDLVRSDSASNFCFCP